MELEAEVVGLRVQVAELTALVVELKARLDADSRTSSKPPSSDGLSKRPAVPRERGKRSRVRRWHRPRRGRWLTCRRCGLCGLSIAHGVGAVGAGM